jgi:ABC-type sulfate transport system substrate-binding protein
MMSAKVYQQTGSGRGRNWARGLFIAFILLCCLTNCRRRSDIAKEATLTIYGFSVAREPLENEIVPAFTNDWEKKTGQKLTFTLSFAGSEMVTNQIVSGVEAGDGTQCAAFV